MSFKQKLHSLSYFIRVTLNRQTQELEIMKKTTPVAPFQGISIAETYQSQEKWQHCFDSCSPEKSLLFSVPNTF